MIKVRITNCFDWNQIKKNLYEESLYSIIPTEPYWYGTVNSDCPHIINQEQYDKQPVNELAKLTLKKWENK